MTGISETGRSKAQQRLAALSPISEIRQLGRLLNGRSRPRNGWSCMSVF